MNSVDTLHDVASAALWAKVSEDTVRAWTKEGLRYTVVGTVGERGPRNYRFLESWLVEFLKARSRIARPAAEAGAGEVAPADDGAKGRRRRVKAAPRPASDGSGWRAGD